MHRCLVLLVLLAAITVVTAVPYLLRPEHEHSGHPGPPAVIEETEVFIVQPTMEMKLIEEIKPSVEEEENIKVPSEEMKPVSLIEIKSTEEGEIHVNPTETITIIENMKPVDEKKEEMSIPPVVMTIDMHPTETEKGNMQVEILKPIEMSNEQSDEVIIKIIHPDDMVIPVDEEKIETMKPEVDMMMEIKPTDEKSELPMEEHKGETKPVEIMVEIKPMSEIPMEEVKPMETIPADEQKGEMPMEEMQPMEIMKPNEKETSEVSMEEMKPMEGMPTEQKGDMTVAEMKPSEVMGEVKPTDETMSEVPMEEVKPLEAVPVDDQKGEMPMEEMQPMEVMKPSEKETSEMSMEEMKPMEGMPTEQKGDMTVAEMKPSEVMGEVKPTDETMSEVPMEEVKPLEAVPVDDQNGEMPMEEMQPMEIMKPNEKETSEMSMEEMKPMEGMPTEEHKGDVTMEEIKQPVEMMAEKKPLDETKSEIPMDVIKHVESTSTDEQKSEPMEEGNSVMPLEEMKPAEEQKGEMSTQEMKPVEMMFEIKPMDEIKSEIPKEEMKPMEEEKSESSMEEMKPVEMLQMSEMKPIEATPMEEQKEVMKPVDEIKSEEMPIKEMKPMETLMMEEHKNEEMKPMEEIKPLEAVKPIEVTPVKPVEIIDEKREESIPNKETETINPKDGMETYEGAQLLKIKATTPEQKHLLNTLQETGMVDIWLRPAKGRNEVDVMVAAEALPIVKTRLDDVRAEYRVIIPDVQRAIETENPHMTEEELSALADRAGHRMTWQSYHSLSDIHGYLDYLAQTFPDLCSVTTIGQSVENKPLKMLRISSKKGRATSSSRPAFWIDGGIHAREWISPASVTYIIQQLVEHHDDHGRIAEDIDYYILPVVNPDGYEYTRQRERLWRKNRSSAHLGRCAGTDLNRNWGYKWGGPGSSKDRCKEIYAGETAFSEPETQAIRNFVSAQASNIRGYVTFHSYGQYILYPWGYDRKVPPDYADLDKVGKQAASAMRSAGGASYTVGNSASTLYPASGGADDWAKGGPRIKYTYTIELRDRGQYGFLLPASFIQPTGKEAFAAVKTIAQAILGA